MPSIVKADGSVEAFRPEKLISSLRRSGASEAIARDILAHIEGELSEGVSTETIYAHAQALLSEHETVAAAKYSLRRALFNLGPTGFPFEDFLAELLRAEGYTAETGVMLRGKCVEHEVDIVAHKDNECLVVEAKFHARPGTKSDLQVALYSHARFQDLEGVTVAGVSCPVQKGMVITNTKFTKAAEEYARCMNLALLSWSAPHGNTLQDRIERARIYPITALSRLSTRDKRLLIERGVVLCRDLSAKRDMMREAGISAKKIETIVEDAVNLCQG